jgi:hypothetical protein
VIGPTKDRLSMSIVEVTGGPGRNGGSPPLIGDMLGTTVAEGGADETAGLVDARGDDDAASVAEDVGCGTARGAAHPAEEITTPSRRTKVRPRPFDEEASIAVQHTGKQRMLTS